MSGRTESVESGHCTAGRHSGLVEEPKVAGDFPH